MPARRAAIRLDKGRFENRLAPFSHSSPVVVRLTRMERSVMPEPIKADTHAFPLRCRKCGSNRFVVPAHSTNESIVTCTDCGAEIGRWGDVRVGILEEANRKRAANM